MFMGVCARDEIEGSLRAETLAWRPSGDVGNKEGSDVSEADASENHYIDHD